jgi:hypothetical protein
VNDRYLSHLLNIIQHKRTLADLLDFGLDYSQISSLLLEAMEQGYIVNAEHGLELSDPGKAKASSLTAGSSGSGPSMWILPRDQDRITKIGKNDIYLPLKREF